MNRFLLVLTTPFYPAAYKEIFPKFNKKQVFSLLAFFMLLQILLTFVGFLISLPGTITAYRLDTKKHLENAVQSMEFTTMSITDNRFETDLKNMPVVFTIKETDKQKTIVIIDTSTNAHEMISTYADNKELMAIAFFADTIQIQTTKDSQESHAYSEVFGNASITYSKQQILDILASDTDIHLAKNFLLRPLSLLLLVIVAVILGIVFFSYRYVGALILSFIFAIVVFSFLPAGPQRRPLTLIKLNIFAYMGWTTTMLLLKIVFLPFGGLAPIYSFLNLFIVPEVFMWFVYKAVAIRTPPKEKKKG